jgi:hypothetical protein
MARRSSVPVGVRFLLAIAPLSLAVGLSGACSGAGDAPEAAPPARLGPVAGGACPTEGEARACGVAVGESGDAIVCGFGEATCTGGAWGPCVVAGPVTLAPRGDAAGYETLGLGSSAACGTDNACDPYCFQFKDNGSGLGSLDGGTTEWDGGVSLKASDGGAAQAGQCSGGVSGACTHSICTAGPALVSACDQPAYNCVAKVCAPGAHPECCSLGWDALCVGYVPQLCSLTCAADTNGTCVLCFQDAVDHDGDGWSYAQGDCRDCDATINPGAYDFPGNGLDEDCSGKADDETPVCDGALAMASANPFDHAKAIGLCPKADPLATGAAKKWGVLDAKLVQADGSSTPNSLSYGILTKLGPNNPPHQGTQMAAYSSGTARAPGDPNYVDPSYSYVQGVSCPFPTGFPKSKVGCPGASGQANDSSGLWLKIRVPTNAKSFAYDFDFFSAEYPEWVCTPWNDSYVALLHSSYVPANPASNYNNISFDAQSNPVSVNIGFFGVPGCPTCSSAKLTSTGFDGNCGGYACGGATGWLQTNAPVVPGETITIQFAIWDTSDEYYDSTVLVDNWRWSPNPSQIVTNPPTPPAPPKYVEGTFTRDFQASCPVSSHLAWTYYVWTATTPGNSSIVFTAQTADTQAGLAAATPTTLFTALNQNGTAFVALSGLPGGVSHPWLRVVADLKPTSDGLQAPTLASWTAQYDCLPTE